MSEPSLVRGLGTGDAVVVGLGAMLGAGVFAVFAPAAEAAGAGLLLGLALAAAVAFCNATASAQLAVSHPSSGGTYHFGRVVLGPWWGFLAGWAFVVGKTASCAAMALTFASYAFPSAPGWLQRGVAVVAVLLLTAANLRGVTRTARVARGLLAVTLVTLVVVVVVLLASPTRAPQPWDGLTVGLDPVGVVQSAGLLFFALAGYARIATLAEEVRRPEVLDRAVLVALGTAVALYAVLAVGLLLVLGPALATAESPLAAAVRASGADAAVPVVRVGAAAACLGALLALLAGVGRTTLAMAREGDLPRALASVSPVHRVPDRAQLAIGAAAVVLLVPGGLREVIGFSSLGVLVYYAVTNLAALRQPPMQRRWPRALHLIGLVGCLVLAIALPAVSVATGAVVLALGLLGRAVVLHRSRS